MKRLALQAAGTFKADIVSVANSTIVNDIDNWKIASDLAGNNTKNQQLLNKAVRVNGWRYTAANEPDHPQNLEMVDLIREILPLQIQSVPPSDGTNIGGFAAKFIAPNTTKDFNPGDVAGVQLGGDLSDLTIKVGNIDVPILAVVNDLVAFGIPSNLPPDIYHAIISAAGGSITLENAIRILAPQPSATPTPSTSPPPGGQTVTAIVSSLIAGSHQPSNPTLFSALMNFVNEHNSSPAWIGLTPGVPVSVQYPTVPDIRNPGILDTAIPLRVDLQVANNSSQGGFIRVISGSTNSINFPGTEGQIMTHTFPFGASEASGVDVAFEVSGTDPNAQIIFVIRAEP